jgi:hypothetical protein
VPHQAMFAPWMYQAWHMAERVEFAGGRSRTFNLPERREIEKIAKSKPVERNARPRHRATYNRNDGVKHPFAAYDLGRDRLHQYATGA